MNVPDRDPTRRAGSIMTWLAVLTFFGLLWLFFDAVLERRDNPNRKLTPAPGSASEMTLKRNPGGHYLAPGAINGQAVVFLLDTGATQVSVPARLGTRLGLPVGAVSKVSTANGYVTVRSTTIDELVLGPFVAHQVQAHLNPGMDHDDTVLLGMSVLRHLEFTQRGDTLILRAPPP
jgi:aspartyl protease family protein